MGTDDEEECYHIMGVYTYAFYHDASMREAFALLV
jgi:hypothetical protein